MKSDNFLGTYSGRHINPLDPNPAEVVIEDIAEALSKICRFNGHTKRIYTVAEHSLNVEQMLHDMGCQANTCLFGLIHDAAEAYICDIPRPLKKLLPEYSDIESSVQKSIYKALRLPEPSVEQNDIVKFADDYILALEAKELMKNTDDWALMEVHEGDRLYDWDNVQFRFVRRLDYLLQQVRI